MDIKGVSVQEENGPIQSLNRSSTPPLEIQPEIRQGDDPQAG